MNPTEQARQRKLGTIAGAAAYSTWGLFPLYFHHAPPASPLELLFHRMVWTLLFVSITLALLRSWNWTSSLSVRLVARLAVAAAALSTNWGIYIWAVNNDHVVDAALGYFINPLVTVALGVVVLGERLRRLQRWAVGLGALSVAVLTVAYGKPPWISLSLAFSFAAYGYLKKTIALPALASLAVETATMVPVAVVGLTVIGLNGDSTFTSAGAGHTTFMVMAGIVTAGPLVLFGLAARRIPLSQLGLLQYCTPVLQMLCGVVAFGESVPVERWIGFAIVWMALACLLTDALRSNRDDQAITPAARSEASASSS